MSRSRRRRGRIAALTAALTALPALWLSAPAAQATPAPAAHRSADPRPAVHHDTSPALRSALTQVSTDPFTNTSSQHATELEPDTYAYGKTIVASSQVGRFTDGGASDIGWNTSTDGGTTWQHGMLPGITTYQGGSWARVSDPAVAYDARHGTWMVAGLVIDSDVNGAGVTVSRSTNGTSWKNPVMAIGNDGQGYDKEWIVCDNTSSSPHYGTCYTRSMSPRPATASS